MVGVRYEKIKDLRKFVLRRNMKRNFSTCKDCKTKIHRTKMKCCGVCGKDLFCLSCSRNIESYVCKKKEIQLSNN